ncbi:hypothetical protein BGX31_004819, partial [Mortierella sp. GBA43]
IAQLFNVAEMSKAESGNGEGVQIVKNEPYEDKDRKGQYTHKVRCKTEITNKYMADYFYITIESLHVNNDRGQLINALKLNREELEAREVITIDVANDPKEYSITTKYNPEKEDVGSFRSEKAQRGPLQGDWSKTCDPVMTCYKVVRIKFKWLGIQTLVEAFIAKAERELFTRFHRELFTSMDKWYGLTMEDIRELEVKAKEELANKLITAGSASGSQGKASG